MIWHGVTWNENGVIWCVRVSVSQRIKDPRDEMGLCFTKCVMNV